MSLAVVLLAVLPERLRTEAVVHKGKCSLLFAQLVAKKPQYPSNLPATNLFTAVIVTNPVALVGKLKLKELFTAPFFIWILFRLATTPF